MALPDRQGVGGVGDAYRALEAWDGGAEAKAYEAQQPARRGDWRCSAPAIPGIRPARRRALKPSTIAIDGPAASGKSTVGELLAQRLGYLTLDTGVMYRAVTWVALTRGIPIDDEHAVTALAESLHIDVLPATVDDGRQCTVTVDGQDVSWEVRSAPVDANVSVVSAYPGVRREMVRQQQRVAAGGRVVMIGRDIGTVVMPDADLKVYLDATVDERARRRWGEKCDRGEIVDYGAVLASMRRRDDIDSHREVSPLQAAADAVIVDTTDLGIEAVLDVLVNLVKECGCPRA